LLVGSFMAIDFFVALGTRGTLGSMRSNGMRAVTLAQLGGTEVYVGAVGVGGDTGWAGRVTAVSEGLAETKATATGRAALETASVAVAAVAAVLLVSALIGRPELDWRGWAVGTMAAVSVGVIAATSVRSGVESTHVLQRASASAALHSRRTKSDTSAISRAQFRPTHHCLA
jgi:hypothetical protein